MDHHRWNDIPTEQMNPRFARQVIHAGRITLARLHLNKGGVVPRHSHENEQISIIETGSLKFIFDDRETVVGAGEVMRIAPNVPHGAEVLEDSYVYDVFSPVREDWRSGNDDYLRR